MTTPSQIARRSTADGKHVLLWDDGSLTWALGHAIKGSAWPRSDEQRSRALAAGWLVLGEVSLYDAGEVTTLVRAARSAVKRDIRATPGDVRAEHAKLNAPKPPRAMWTVLQADASGRPTVRVWRLPRLSHPGLAIWHERGVYAVVRRVVRHAAGFRGAPVYEATGFRARTLRHARHLADVAAGRADP